MHNTSGKFITFFKGVATDAANISERIKYILTSGKMLTKNSLKETLTGILVKINYS